MSTRSKKKATEDAPETVEKTEQVTLAPAENEVGKGDAVVHPFSFQTEDLPQVSPMLAIDRLNSRIAKGMRDAVEQFARTKPSVKAERTSMRRYESWRSEQPDFVSLSLYRFHPLKGMVMLAIEASLVGRLVDSFYGGTGDYDERKIKEFTATEERLLTRLSEVLIETITEVWSEVTPVKAQLNARETNTAYASLVRGDEAVAIARFTVSIGKGKPARIDIIYPIASLGSVESELVAKVHDETSVSRRRLAASLAEVRVEARSVLARPTLSVSEVLDLQPGDIIPISVPAQVPLFVGGRLLGYGAIGDEAGQAAIRIEKLSGRDAA